MWMGRLERSPLSLYKHEDAPLACDDIIVSKYYDLQNLALQRKRIQILRNMLSLVM